eukprot:TRINITY_DN22254_c0_g1_i1.p1 TRINITY_DN22254_c0_g1~~TRINITY_DN22254_c0_g1_i1.p1  ORF type:complete len:540 (+),score=133.32 TRINITY_DN22254_c0_g1_i1:84-1622(+)
MDGDVQGDLHGGRVLSAPLELAQASPGGVWELKARFQDVEYEDFAVARQKCKRLSQRCIIILNQLSLSNRAAKPPLHAVMTAALHLLHECLDRESAVPKMLLGFALGHLFAGTYQRLRRVWSSHPPAWDTEDESDALIDCEDVLRILENPASWRPCHYGSSELWGFLEGLPATRDVVAAKLTRQHAIIDFADVVDTEVISESVYTTVTAASYRGSRIVIKEIRPEVLALEESQQNVLHGTTWVRVRHPHIVPVVGWASTRIPTHTASGGNGGANAAAPEICAVISTLYAPGYSLRQLWCDNGQIPNPGQLLTICRQVAEALLYVELYVEDDCQYIDQLPLGNVLIDAHTGAVRIIPTMAFSGKMISRWQPPRSAVNRHCYMVGLLLWSAMAHSEPMPHILTQEGVKEAVLTGSWRPELGPLAGLQSLASFIRECTALDGGDAHSVNEAAGFAGISDLLLALDETMAGVQQHDLHAMPLQLSTIPISPIDTYGSVDAPHPLQPATDTSSGSSK